MRLTICDGAPEERQAARALAEEYIRRRGLDMDLVCFASAGELLAWEQSRGAGELYLTELRLPDMDGAELVRRIRARRPRAAVIFLTWAEDGRAQAFSVHAFDYLAKPAERHALFRSLDECLALLKPPARRIAVKTADGEIFLEPERINAVEYSGHRFVFRLAGGGSVQSLYRREPFGQLAGQLVDTGRFIRCAEGYVVNMENVRTVTAAGLGMADGTQYVVTRKYAEAKRRAAAYLAERGGVD